MKKRWLAFALAGAMTLTPVVDISASQLATSTDSDEQESMQLEPTNISEEETIPEDLLTYHGDEEPAPIYIPTNDSSISSNRASIPASYDSRTKNVITPVKNQNPYGTCWSFAAMGAAEASMVSQGYSTLADADYSELQFAYFFYHPVSDPLGNCSNDGNAPGVENFLDQGGNTWNSILTLASWVGVAKESKANYSAASPTVVLDSSLARDDVAHLQNAYKINTAGNPEGVKQQVMENGAVATSIYWTDSTTYFDKNTESLYVDKKFMNGSQEISTNHAIEIIGWNDTYAVSNFSASCRPSAPGAWLIKNSWGSYHDYIWVSYEDAYIKNENAYSLIMEPADNYDFNYQYDGSGYTGMSFPVAAGNSVANTYTVSGYSREQLEAVSFALDSANVSYSIQIYKNPTSSDPFSGTPLLASPKTGTTSYAGYYTIKLDQPLQFVKGDTFAVAITITGSSASFILDRSADWGWIKFTNDTTNDKSYIKMGATLFNLPVQYGGTTARIKAFTTKVEGGVHEHSYGSPTFNWASDASSCTATFNCLGTDCAESKTVKCSSITSEITTQPTCVSKGTTTYTATVSFEGKTFTGLKALENLPKSGKHSFKSVKFAWVSDGSSCEASRTCTYNCGTTEYEDCDIASTVITPSTCKQKGVTRYTATVYFDNTKYTSTKDVTDIAVSNNHTYGTPTFSWADDASSCSATAVCTLCSNSSVKSCTITSVVKTPASCTENGTTTYTATVIYNNKTYTGTKDLKNIKSTGEHGYGAPTFAWSADGTSCTATSKCVSCTATKSQACAVTSKITKEATCSTKGNKTYTATVLFNGKTYTATKDVDIPATGKHTYAISSASTFTWSTDGKSCTVKAVCAGCGASQSKACTVTSKVKTAATCTTKGTTTYTATITYNGVTVTKTKDVQDIALKAHDYSKKITTADYLATPANYTTAATYYYACSTCNKKGTTTYTYGSKLQLTTPTIKTISVGASGVAVTWDAVKNAEIYRLYRKVAGGSWTKVGDTAKTTKVDTTAVPGTTYYYTLRCLNSERNVYMSDYDRTGKAFTYCSNPVMKTTTICNGYVKISWDAVGNAEVYRVYRKESGGSWTKLCNTTKTIVADQTVESGKTYYYTVRCLNADKTAYTSYFDTTGISVTYCSTPVLGTVSKTSAGAKLTWKAVSGAGSYRIYRKTNKGSWENIGYTTSTSFVDKTAKAGNTYTYSVRCMNAARTQYLSEYDRIGVTIKY